MGSEKRREGVGRHVAHTTVIGSRNYILPRFGCMPREQKEERDIIE